MKIIKAGFDLWQRDDQRGGIAMIERAGRVCYKTEEYITPESADTFVKNLIRRGHLAMLEHGDYIFAIEDYHIYNNIAEGLQMLRDKFGKAPKLAMTNLDNRPIISGNVRAWRELVASGSGAAYYFTGQLDPIFTDGLIPDAERIDDPRIRRIHASDLVGRTEQLTHNRQTVCFTTDRGVSHEYVRHRNFSFAMESTRYCNYSQGRFGKELTVIEPCYLVPHTEPYDLWKRSCMTAETEYFTMLNLGLQAQEARAVLPHSVKTDLIMTGTLGDWNHFFDLRARQVTGPAHPQAVELAEPLMLEMANRFPGVIEK